DSNTSTASSTNANRGKSDYLTNSNISANTTYYWKSNATITIEKEDVSLHSEASKETSLNSLPKGSKVKLIASQGNWHQVEVLDYNFTAGMNPSNTKSSDIGWIFYVLNSQN
ncbi:MAG: hypothetical protein ABWZ66_11545, partial [Pyrinomonadaceae bacterium]